MKKNGLQIPPQLEAKLVKFRRQIWRIKLIEGICGAAFGLLISYLIVFTLDRFYDTSHLLRIGLLVTGTLGLAVWLPWVCHRWIWGSRRMEQVAKMLKVNHPRMGDYLLGIIELVNHNDFDGNSESLTRAALAQADRQTANKDFSNDVPYPKHRRWALIAGVPLLLAGLLLCIVPAAGNNAMQRWLMPWRNIDRFTFTQLEPIRERKVVPLAEPVVFETQLTDQSDWRPDSGSAWIGTHEVKSAQEDGHYKFQLPPMETANNVNLRIGDAIEKINIDPHPRPELQSLTAIVELPDYLQRTEPVRTEIRGGGVSIVKGSSVSLEAEATRDLESAMLDSQPVNVIGNQITTDNIALDESRTVELVWEDKLALSAKSPLLLKLRSTKDKAPRLTCRELEQKRVIMAKDVLSFQIDATDDFGVKTIGMEWVGEVAPTSAAAAAKGEKIVSAGNPEATVVNEVVATFSPDREKIEPQVIKLKLFAEDYLPDRPRVYSQPYTVYVLSEDEHAIWMTGRMNDWFKKGLETYEREQQLFKRNRELRDLSPEELDRAETRRQIESQATAEQAQTRRLKSLTKAGDELIEEAARNDQFGVDHLETLAEMMERLKDIHDNRMPSVSDLLTKAAEAAASPKGSQPSQTKPSPSNQDPAAGKPQQGKPQQGESQQGESKQGESKQGESKQGEPQQGDPQQGQPQSESESKEGDSEGSEDSDKTSVTDNPELPGAKKPEGDSAGKDEDEDKKEKVDAPSISMKESSMDEPEQSDEPEEPAEPTPTKPGTLKLPDVTLNDPAKKDPAAACPAAKEMDSAVESQEQLLAEFQEIAEELQKLISNLEGSTFVKRLKAMSRRELVVADDVTQSSLQGFGEPKKALKKASVTRTKLIAKRQRAHGKALQDIQDDLDAYSNRVQEGKFKTVLAEMRELDAIKQVNTVAKRMEANEPGTSIAQAELLADTFDRWAEQLVGPG